MKQEILINELVKSTKKIFEDCLKIVPVEFETANYIEEDEQYEVSVINSITGDTKGIFLIRCSEETAQKLADNLCNIMDTSEVNPICTLANKITREAARNIIDMDLDFSESAMIRGKDVEFGFASSSKVRAIRIELDDIGKISIVVVYKKK